MEPWQKIGWMKAKGIPAPSGCYEVGCMDLMHKLEGDSDGLLVRLFYPTDPGLAEQYQYAKTTPHSRYILAAVDDVFNLIRIPSCLRTFFSFLKPLHALFG